MVKINSVVQPCTGSANILDSADVDIWNETVYVGPSSPLLKYIAKARMVILRENSSGQANAHGQQVHGLVERPVTHWMNSEAALRGGLLQIAI